MLAYKTRFGDLGQKLAQELYVFSYDIMGLIAGYLICDVPFFKGKANVLLEMKQREPFGTCRAIAYSTIHHELWIAQDNFLSVFDPDGKFLRRMTLENLSHISSMGINKKGHIFCVGRPSQYSLAHRIISCTPQGQILNDFVSLYGLKNLIVGDRGFVFVFYSGGMQVLNQLFVPVHQIEMPSTLVKATLSIRSKRIFILTEDNRLQVSFDKFF